MTDPQDTIWNPFELAEQEDLSKLPTAAPLMYQYNKAKQEVEVVYTFPDSFTI
jgi:hypothetical protein